MKKLLASVAFIAVMGTANGASLTSEILALNHAFRVADDEAVDRYLSEALKTSPNDPALLNQAMLSAVYQQDVEKAASFLPVVNKLGVNNQTSDLIEIADGILNDNFKRAAEYGAKFDFFDDDIMQAWAIAQEGDVDGAIRTLEAASIKTPPLDPIYKYETAMLIAHFSKDYEKADAILTGDNAPLYLTDLSLYAHMAMKILNGKSEQADTLMNQRYGEEANWPAPLRNIVASARDGKIDPTLNFASPQNIAAEYMSFVLSQSQNGGIPYQTERLFVTLIPAIAPENDAYKVDMLQYFYSGQEYDDVVKFAEKFNTNSAFKGSRDLYMFSALLRLDREDEAKKVIEGMPEEGIDGKQSKADGFRQLEDYETALGLYESILTHEGINDARRVSAGYNAAICAERLGQWPKAEGYFRDAIALQPESAEMLNYLGYSLVDSGKNVEEGLKLIEKAVELNPSEAYILDSLGWAYFHVGRYEDAVRPLELAISQMSSDPIVNGHLGDVYWNLGRKREARYQWERTIKFLEEDLPDMKRADVEDRLKNGLAD